MNPNGEEVIDAAGYNTFIFESSQANIQLLSDESYKENNTLFKHCMEKDLVHELLHCKYDWMGCQGRTYEGVYLDATEHQKLEERKWQRVLSWQNMVSVMITSCEVQYDNGGGL